MSVCGESSLTAEQPLLDATSASRDRIVEMLKDYIELSAMKRAFEDAFGGSVLHNAALLQELVERRRRLTSMYRAIRTRLERGGYAGARGTGELERDIRVALGTDTGPGREPDDPTPVRARPRQDEMDSDPWNAETDDPIDEPTRKRILRAFKRIVLPKVHADTSDAPFAVFDLAYSAYRRRDCTLMEAFVIDYSGEVGREDDGRLLSEEQLADRTNDYRAAERRMSRRLRALGQTLTPDERDAPEETLRHLEQQGMEFRQAIDEEAERVAELRSRLEALLIDVPAENGAGR